MYNLHFRWIKEFDSPDLTSRLEETEHQRAILALKAEEYQAELRNILVRLVVAIYDDSEMFRDLILPSMLCVQGTKPTITVADFLAQKERLRKKEHEVKIKRARIQAFQGLPPVRHLYTQFPRFILTRHSLSRQNLALAKQELHQAREELIRLSNLRERLLNNMVEEIS